MDNPSDFLDPNKCPTCGGTLFDIVDRVDGSHYIGCHTPGCKRIKHEDAPKDPGCTCTPCPECKGTGNVWYSDYGRGEYLGSSRSDDCDDLETCDFCEGSGISHVCQRCMDMDDNDDF